MKNKAVFRIISFNPDFLFHDLPPAGNGGETGFEGMGAGLGKGDGAGDGLVVQEPGDVRIRGTS
jgi:hypothetical protein